MKDIAAMRELVDAAQQQIPLDDPVIRRVMEPWIVTTQTLLYWVEQAQGLLEGLAVTSCREELGAPTHDRCNAPAEFILWGKLFSTKALGPRCYEHAAVHLGDGALRDPDTSGWAIVDLRPALRALGRL